MIAYGYSYVYGLTLSCFLRINTYVLDREVPPRFANRRDFKQLIVRFIVVNERNKRNVHGYRVYAYFFWFPYHVDRDILATTQMRNEYFGRLKGIGDAALVHNSGVW